MKASVRGQNLTYGIAEDLGISIVTGNFSDGQPFPVEAELCKIYGVSRSILREAVKMLTAKGLLDSRPRQGTTVQAESRWNLLDPDVLRWMLERKFSFSLLTEFTQVRLAIEPKAAAMAAIAASPSEKARVRDAVQAMIEAERLEEDPLEPDIAFHLAVLRASGNKFFMQLGELIDTALRFSIRMTNRQTGVRSVSEHKVVCDAIVAGNAKRAENAMKELIEAVRDQIVKAEIAAMPRAKGDRAGTRITA
jgi:DNA-binding FadR family transcriptional regulator